MSYFDLEFVHDYLFEFLVANELSMNVLWREIYLYQFGLKLITKQRQKDN